MIVEPEPRISQQHSYQAHQYQQNTAVSMQPRYFLNHQLNQSTDDIRGIPVIREEVPLTEEAQ
jgi:hypothetical protein